MNGKENAKSKRLKAAAIILGIAAVIASFFTGFLLRGAIVGKDAAALSEIAAYLKKYGVFDSTTAELREFSAEDAARLVIDNLPDEYATYYSAKEYDALTKRRNGKYEGVGIAVYAGTLDIAQVIINSPAFRAGFKAGDVLVSGRLADGREFTFTDDLSVGKFLAAAGENAFEITVSRKGETLTFGLRSEKYKSAYLLYKDKDGAFAYLGDYDEKLKLTNAGDGIYDLPEDVAYIRFDSFEGGAAQELKGMTDFMAERGKTKLILDMRGNGGGQMEVLSDFAGGVIKGANKMVLAYSKDNKGNFTEYNASRNYYNDCIEKIAVIADEFSASATECLIGAMIHYGGAFSENALIIENESLTDGKARTYGKGIMQTTFTLSNGGAIKLTTAVVYRPDKTTCIHGKGITVSGDNAVVKSENKAIDRAVAVISG